MKTKNSDINWDNYYAEHVSLLDRPELTRQWRAHGNFYIKWLQHIDNIVPLYKKNLKTFEIGSGLGGVLQLLHERKVPVTGSDISKKAVSVSRILNPDYSYIYFNVETMPLPEGKYDRILAFEILEHLDRLDIALVHIRKGLKKDGYFVGTTPYPYEKHINMPTHINVLHPFVWKRLFLKGGFSEVATYPMSLPPILWRIHPMLNLIFPLYVPLPFWISTTLIVAKK